MWLINYLHKEHFDDEGTNTIDNCVPACKSCNSSKGVKPFENWFSGEEWRKVKIYKWLNSFTIE